MRKAMIVVVLLGLLLLPAAAAAAAPAPHHMAGTFTTWWTGPPDFGAPGCPEGSEYRMTGAGVGEIETPVYAGPVDVVPTHCSSLFKPLDPSVPGRLVGAMDGRMTITTPDGSTLVLTQKGMFTIDLLDTPGAFVTQAVPRIEVVDGTGVFLGAAGHGHLTAIDTGLSHVELVGSLVFTP